MKFKKKNERRNKIKYDYTCMECNKNPVDRMFEIDLNNKKNLIVRLCNTCILVYARRYLQQKLLENEINEINEINKLTKKEEITNEYAKTNE